MVSLMELCHNYYFTQRHRGKLALWNIDFVNASHSTGQAFLKNKMNLCNYEIMQSVFTNFTPSPCLAGRQASPEAGRG